MSMEINFENLVRKLLPLHKRQAIRLWWLRGLVSPLTILFTAFDKWRNDTRKTLYLNSQIKILESYLSKKYGQPISIITLKTDTISVSFRRGDGASSFSVGFKNTDDDSAVKIPFRGAKDADFIVNIPIGIDANAARADIERFKSAVAKYKIEQL